MKRGAVGAMRGAVVAIVGVLLLTPAASWAQGAWNVELLGQWRNGGGGRSAYMDVWGYAAPDGTELAIIGTQGGVSIIDVTDPSMPIEVGAATLPVATHRDMRTHGTHAYAVNENGGGGLAIIDLSDPQAPFLVKNWEEAFSTAHNLHIADGYAYVVGCRGLEGTTSTTILDLADPENPVKVGGATRYLHDIYVRDDIGYGSAINDNGIVIMDLSDKTAPSEISFTSYAGANTHNAWLTDDGNTLLTTDEVTGGDVHIWNVSNLRSPQAITTWTANPNAIVHNVTIRGDSAYISYYTEGLQVLDISDPAQPTQVAYYDTWPGASGGFNGAWGVYPFLPSGNVLVSDITSGLFVFKLVEGQMSTPFLLNPPELLTAQPGTTQLYYYFELQNTSSSTQNFSVTAATTLGWPVDYPPSYSLPAMSTGLILATVSVPPTLQIATPVHIEVCVQSSSGNLCASTDPTTPVLLQAFDARVEDYAVHLRWDLHVDPGEVGTLHVLRSTVHVEPPGVPDDVPGLSDRTGIHQAALGSGEYVDTTAEPGVRYTYWLGLTRPERGLTILGEVPVMMPAPVRSRLRGNVPNPFNPHTRIEFELAQPGSVDLRIFDSRGRLLRTLQAPRLTAGLHALPWDGRDERGNSLASGAYFYQVRSGRWQATGRMTLIR
jgi:choice-of-anchor B domain-containing protein